ncbi:hypothetical protein UFOVP957_29 [uncultured Caudovirales phage]|uniref:Holliday junction resolvase n=1 Tax=uncultured Caudovirales phage TaxID=2100421 RepID=A0A6J5RCJ7_9CAUD|nr:hypothetical protein UFOVP283_19 [uncultured Caudovirales phage]CAB4174225.1 hypothetical protein UFOVP957_29 [uncultured Caudovirales phage]CAB4192186.1 hypothetical protein UFOVP1231_10 [uncultured Caudovirales phage]
MNPSKAKGTRGETAVVNYLRGNGFPTAERRALAGAADRGDILATVGVILEVKAGTSAQVASPAVIERWMQQTRAEAINAGVDVAALIVQRRGIGTSRPEHWTAHIDGGVIDGLCRSYLYRGLLVSMNLADFVYFLRRAGHGDTL